MRGKWLLTAGLFAAVALRLPAAFAEDEEAQDTSRPLQEIVVTAQKKREDIQSVPIAVMAISGDTLIDTGVTNLRSLAQFIPSAKLNIDGGATELFIRGVGSSLDEAWISEAVTFNVNGAASPRFANGSGFYDIAAIEVVPGPQGTLYGGNTAGGTINVTTNMPVDKFESSGLLEFGDYTLIHGTGVLNVPINDHLYVRAAFNEAKHDGYESNGADSQDSIGVRLSALYEPTDMLSAYLWGSYSKDTGIPPVAWYYPHPAPEKNAWTLPEHDPVALGPPFSPVLGTNLYDVGFGNYDTSRVGAQLDVRFDWATLSYLPSYLDHSGADQVPAAGFVQNRAEGYNQYTQELRLTNNTRSRTQWIAGLYWYQKIATQDTIFGPNLSGDIVSDHFEGEAAFGQLTYSVTDRFRVTAGGRVSQDKLSTPDHTGIFPVLSFAPSTSPFNFDSDFNTCQGLGIGIPCHFDRGQKSISFSHTWGHVDWKAGAEFDIAENSLAYASVQTGYNEGSYDNSLSNFGALIRPQTLLAYTFGTKNRLFLNRLEVNDEAYYYDYDNLILQYINAGNGSTQLFNAPKSVIYGNDFRLAALVTNGLKLTTTIGYLNAKIRKFQPAGADFDGYTLINSPTWTFALSLEQTWAVASGAHVSALASAHYEGGFYGDFVHSQGLYIRAETLTDVSLSYRSASEKWSISLWAKNLTNEARIEGAAATGLAAPYSAAGFYDPPRTIGVRLEAKY